MSTVFVLNGFLGGNFRNEKAFEHALRDYTVDFIANDGGSMDIGPYYLGANEGFASREALKNDLNHLLDMRQKNKCPIAIGTCGGSGARSHVEQFRQILAELVVERGEQRLKVAVIDSTVDPRDLLGRLGQLEPIGRFPLPPEDVLLGSNCVAQMGVHPFITALDMGADIVLAGRACDVSIFASGLVNLGHDPGIAHHVGHILECGGICLSPSSGLDCVVAELDDQGRAFFHSPAAERKATTYSIAAHSFYEEAHPALQKYPEGTLTFEKTRFLPESDTVAGLTDSHFVASPLSIKIEGSAKIGERVVSALPCQPDIPQTPDGFIYGRDGVEGRLLTDAEKELGVVARVVGADEAVVNKMSVDIKLMFLHYGYPNRKTTSGNVAFPHSPTSFMFTNADGLFEDVIICGSREQLFIDAFPEIRSTIMACLARYYGDQLADVLIDISTYDREHPCLVLETVAPTLDEAMAVHDQQLESLAAFVDTNDEHAVVRAPGGAHYEWSVFHVLNDPDYIRDKLFDISLFDVLADEWTLLETRRPEYFPVGETDVSPYDLNPETLMQIPEVAHVAPPKEIRKLADMTKVLRSKDAGIGVITYDLFFTTDAEFEQAVQSGVLDRASIARAMEWDFDSILGCYAMPACNAIKISRYRRLQSGRYLSRDVYGSQQQRQLEDLDVPIY